MFDNRLKDLRISKGFTSKDIAQMLDLKERTYKSYENNEREPDSKILVKIANLFDVSIDYLLDFDVNSIQSNTSLQFSTKEVNLVRAYRSKPDLQKAVDILLGIAESPPQRIVQTQTQEPELKVARTTNLTKTQPRRLTQEQWDTLENGEDVDLN